MPGVFFREEPGGKSLTLECAVDTSENQLSCNIAGWDGKSIHHVEEVDHSDVVIWEAEFKEEPAQNPCDANGHYVLKVKKISYNKKPDLSDSDAPNDTLRTTYKPKRNAFGFWNRKLKSNGSRTKVVCII